jgi:hypothetical protein
MKNWASGAMRRARRRKRSSNWQKAAREFWSSAAMAFSVSST